MIVPLSYDSAIAVTTSDNPGTDANGPFTALLIAAAGTVKFVDEAGNTVNITGSLLAGTVIPVKAVRVFTTGTSATVYGLKAVL